MKKNFFYAALAIALASCASDDFVGENNNSPNPETGNTNAIVFNTGAKKTTRSGEYVGATAADMLGGMFVVEGTKGSEQTNSPSKDVVFDNYLVGYTANTAGVTESNTNNWEYVGLQTGITGKLSGDTWTALHNASTDAKVQSIKYWDYNTAQYDFIAWSTGKREAVTGTPTSGTSVKVTRINTGSTLAGDGFTLTALSAADLKECYYTDINTVLKVNYGTPVTLTFRNMAAKVRVALYETVPGYSVKEVKFYSADCEDGGDPTSPGDLGTGSSADNAVLFTTGSDVLPQSGEVLVYYPHIGINNNTKADYNKASVTVSEATGGAAGVTTQTFGALTDNYKGKESGTTYEPEGNIYLGRTLPTATFAGSAADNYYQAVIPNTNGKPLTLRVDYTLVSTDGSAEEIKVYGAKAVVPATYTVWQPNYAYTYIFKISDNSNGWTSTNSGDPKGLFPITFDAVVASFTDANAEQTTVTTVATPSITTYQQGHDWKNKDEYSKSQTAGVSSNVKAVYVQVMDNSGATPTLKADLNGTNKSSLFAVSKINASEAEVMDALQNRTSDWDEDNPVTDPDDPVVGRNGITLTTNGFIDNTVTSIVNGVDDQPVTVTENTTAEIGIAGLDPGTYAYVYCSTVPSTNEKIYNVVSDATATSTPTLFYEVKLTGTETPLTSGTAAANKVYFVKNVDANGDFVSYTFKQTKVGESVVGLVEASITSKATEHHATSEGNYYFYFDVYNQNDGKYAVKVIKIVA